jgi:hypothetical protein
MTVLVHLIRVYAKRNISQQEYSFHLDEKNELMVHYEADEEGAIMVDNVTRVKITEFFAWFIALPKFISFEVKFFLLSPIFIFFVRFVVYFFFLPF